MSKVYIFLPSIGSVTLYKSTKLAAFCLSMVLLFISITQLPAIERNSFKEATNGILSNSVGQAFSMPTEGKAISHTIVNCKEENQFNSTGSPLYPDEKANTDTITFCPQNPWQVIKVSFTHFDVAGGDALEVYEGDLEQMRNGTATYIDGAHGGSPSLAFGAWVQANCDPDINETGCLTFRFRTNGDYNKGTGWKGWVNCKERNIQLKAPDIRSDVWCGEYSSIITIPGIEVSTDCGIINDYVRVEIIGDHGHCVDAVVSKSRRQTVTQSFAIGVYSIKYTLISDKTKTVSTVFSVGSPNLVCNDKVNISLGSGCSTSLVPDMILENTCDPIPGIMYYHIVVRDPYGNIIAEGGKNGSYPQISHDLIDVCGEDIYTARISMVYFEDFPLAYCNKGVQKETCETEIVFTDKTPPAFSVGTSTDIIYNCNIDLSEEGLKKFRPAIIDNCSSTTATFYSATEISATSNCDKTYTVTWLASDACGNTAYLDRTLIIKRPGIDKIVKVSDTYLSCGEDDPSAIEDFSKAGILGLKVGYEHYGVFYITDTIPLSTTEYVCSYILTKTDQSFPSTCGSKTFRYWQLLDWCDSSTGVVPIDTQLIKFVDTLAPTIHCTPHASLAMKEYINIPGHQCSLTPTFPTPTASDICDPSVMVKTFTVEELGENGYWSKQANNLNQSSPLDEGTYRVGWRAFDICPEQIKEDTCYRYFVLQDKTAPSAVCKDQLNVSIGTDHAKLLPSSIDGGSTDACGIAKLLLRRTACEDPGTWAGVKNTYIADTYGYELDPTGWAEEVLLECCDIQNTVNVELLVIDSKGNYNYCDVNILAEDKISPTCSSLPDQTAYCDEVHANSLGSSTDTNDNGAFDYSEWVKLEGALQDFYNSNYGDPLTNCTDNLACNGLTMEQEYQFIASQCGQLQIKRRFRAVDGQGNPSNWGQQTLTVNYRPDWSVTFPIDWVGYCGNMVPDTDIEISRGLCDKIAYEVRDQVFQTSSGACYKVLRTFTLINWCRFDQDAPVKEINRIVSNTDKVTIPRTVTSADWGEYSSLSYVQILEVRDTEAPVVSVADVEECIIGNACDGEKTFSVSATDCSEDATNYLTYTWQLFANNISLKSGSGNSFTSTVKAGIPYRVEWLVNDQCGNTTWEAPTYLFKDCKPPTPYCISGLAIPLMDIGEVAIWGNDFNIGSYDNCTKAEALDIRIHHPSLGPEPTTFEEVLALPIGVTFNCSHIGTQLVSVYVIDEAGNYDYCTTSVIIQDNQIICNYGQVAGTIAMKDGLAVEETEVHIEGTGNMPAPYMTQTNGTYHFDVSMGADYIIKPFKNHNPLNGVSTYDLVLITKHILGIQPFDSPYQYIAGDANKSNSVTAYDIVLLRKLILNLSTEIQNNTSWRFVSADYEFTRANPLRESFEESILVSDLPGAMANLDFVAIKIGDVSGNAAGNAFTTASPRSGDKQFVVEIKDQNIKKGDPVSVPFYTSSLQEIEGYQFTMSFNNLVFESIEEGIITDEHFGITHSDRGYITTSWNSFFANISEPSSSTSTSTVQKEERMLFQLTFTATKDGQLADFLTINSDLTSAEAYHVDGALLDVLLTTAPTTAEASIFKVAQNKPNPFNEVTTFSFQLPEASDVTLHILDIQGKIVFNKKFDFDSGSHTIPFDQHLPEGTYFYQLSSSFGTITKKMIVVK